MQPPGKVGMPKCGYWCKIFVISLRGCWVDEVGVGPATCRVSESQPNTECRPAEKGWQKGQLGGWGHLATLGTSQPAAGPRDDPTSRRRLECWVSVREGCVRRWRSSSPTTTHPLLDDSS